MKKYCDLHTHSYYSDGGFSPAQLIKMAEAADLSALAIFVFMEVLVNFLADSSS